MKTLFVFGIIYQFPAPFSGDKYKPQPARAGCGFRMNILFFVRSVVRFPDIFATNRQIPQDFGAVSVPVANQKVRLVFLSDPMQFRGFDFTPRPFRVCGFGAIEYGHAFPFDQRCVDKAEFACGGF